MITWPPVSCVFEKKTWPPVSAFSVDHNLQTEVLLLVMEIHFLDLTCLGYRSFGLLAFFMPLLDDPRNKYIVLISVTIITFAC